MKKRIIILTAAAILFASTAVYAASADSTDGTGLALEKVEYADATVTAGRLNVREGPSTSFNSIYKLEKGQSVTVIGKLGGWYAVYNAENGIIGAVDGRYIKVGDGSLTASKTVTAGTAQKTASEKTDSAGQASAGKTAVKSQTPSTADVNLSTDEQKLLELVNKARKDKGLEELAIDENLMNVARTKAKDMTENSYFSHQSPTYGSPFDMMRQFDNAFKSAGENIAGNKTVEGAFKAWMASESHKKNILNTSFTVTGIGVEESKTYGKILVQQFIGR